MRDCRYPAHEVHRCGAPSQVGGIAGLQDVLPSVARTRGCVADSNTRHVQRVTRIPIPKTGLAAATRVRGPAVPIIPDDLLMSRRLVRPVGCCARHHLGHEGTRNLWQPRYGSLLGLARCDGCDRNPYDTHASSAPEDRRLVLEHHNGLRLPQRLPTKEGPRRGAAASSVPAPQRNTRAFSIQREPLLVKYARKRIL